MVNVKLEILVQVIQIIQTVLVLVVAVHVAKLIGLMAQAVVIVYNPKIVKKLN
jgi:hypothetical protein